MEIEFTRAPYSEGTPLYLPVDPSRTDGFSQAIATGKMNLDDSSRLPKQYFTNLNLSGRSFVDVGANVGIYALLVASLGVPVVAIEALAENYLLLSAAVEKNGFRNVRCYHAAAADRLGIVNIGGFSAWGQVAAEGAPTPALTLDHIWATGDFATPALVKIDVEGFEYEVLNGASRLIEEIPDLDIMIEIFEGHEKSLTFLEARGYNCYMIKLGQLIKANSKNFNECLISDYFCTKRDLSAGAFVGMPVLEKTQDISVSLLYSEAQTPDMQYRIRLASRLQHAPADLRNDPRVIALLDALAKGQEADVRDVMNSWYQPGGAI